MSFPLQIKFAYAEGIQGKFYIREMLGLTNMQILIGCVGNRLHMPTLSTYADRWILPGSSYLTEDDKNLIPDPNPDGIRYVDTKRVRYF